MINSMVYSEVYEILKYMDKQVVMKIPIDVLNNIKKNRDIDYKTKINPKDLFNPNNVLPMTMVVMNFIDINYWMDESKKRKIINDFHNKEMKLDEQKRLKYNPNIFG